MIEEEQVLEELIRMADERLRALRDYRKREEAIAAFLKESRPKEARELAQFFVEYGLLLRKWGTGKPPSDYKLAKTVWNGYEDFAPFLREVVTQVSRFDAEFLYPAAGTPGLPKAVRSRLLTFCAKLERGGMLRARKEGEDRLKVELLKRDIKFINGGWGERVTLYLVDRTLRKFTARQSHDYRLFWNVRLSEPGSEQIKMELDVVARVEDHFYIFETKTGEDLDVPKWVERSELFGMKQGRSTFFTCTPRDEIRPKYFKPYRLLPFSELEAMFTNCLEHDFPPPPPTVLHATLSESLEGAPLPTA